MGCGGSTPAKEDVTTKRTTQQQHPPQPLESPCLGLEDDYKFKQKLGQGCRRACAACIFLLFALFSWQSSILSKLPGHDLPGRCRWHGTYVLSGRQEDEGACGNQAHKASITESLGTEHPEGNSGETFVDASQKRISLARDRQCDLCIARRQRFCFLMLVSWASPSGTRSAAILLSRVPLHGSTGVPWKPLCLMSLSLNADPSQPWRGACQHYQCL